MINEFNYHAQDSIKGCFLRDSCTTLLLFLRAASVKILQLSASCSFAFLTIAQPRGFKEPQQYNCDLAITIHSSAYRRSSFFFFSFVPFKRDYIQNVVSFFFCNGYIVKTNNKSGYCHSKNFYDLTVNLYTEVISYCKRKLVEIIHPVSNIIFGLSGFSLDDQAIIECKLIDVNGKSL